MRILDKLERKIGWFAVRNLAVYIVAGNALVWLTGFIFRENAFVERLALVPAAVFKGEVWRIVTFVLMNSFGGSPLLVLIELYFLYFIGQNLEGYWGSFRFTFYYFVSLILTAVVSLLTGVSLYGARYIHLSLFFAFAAIAPEMRILLFFFIPVKIKYLAWAAWAFTAYEFIMSRSWADRLVILAPLAAYAMFFGPQIAGALRRNRSVYANRRKFDRKIAGTKVVKASFHKCEICRITEVDAPDMEFRYCSKCEGNYEYCMTHLNDHFHRSQN